MTCKVMGIVNVTPDSFSDGGQFFRPEEAIRRAKNLVADGADIIDLGGESTRPGATPISWDVEWARIEPVLRGIRDWGSGIRISVDTYHPETAERAIEAGADIINCVYAEPIPEMVRVIADAAQNTELVMPACCFEEIKQSENQKIRQSSLYLDPMIGFNTTREEDVELLRSIPELAKKGRVLVGASRKRIVKKLVGEKSAVGKNVGGNVAIAVWAAMNGASVVRVHDVKETVQAIRVVESLKFKV